MRYLKLILLALWIPGVHASDRLSVCIDYHCEKRADVQIDASDWDELLQPFMQPAETAAMERQQIRDAIARFEKLVGSRTPTHKDLPENKGDDETGQLDCIAESTNTHLYLQWLARKMKLKWHRVDERIKRSPYFIDVHWGVKITSVTDQREFVVDSWYGANAELPQVVPLAKWLKKR